MKKKKKTKQKKNKVAIMDNISRGFINVFSKRVTVFHRQAKLSMN